MIQILVLSSFSTNTRSRGHSQIPVARFYTGSAQPVMTVAYAPRTATQTMSALEHKDLT